MGSLAHVRPLRDFFLRPSNYVEQCTDPLVLRFGELVRKIWSPNSFKNCVASHEFVNEVAVASHTRFRIGQRSQATDFLSWLLIRLHQGLTKTVQTHRRDRVSSFGSAGSGGHSPRKHVIAKDGKVKRKKKKKRPTSIIHRTFQGRVETKTQPLIVKSSSEVEASTENETTATVPFLYLSLDLPPMPLFKDTEGGNIIPQEPL